MIENKRLLLIGGTGRNVGKTEFVCRLISQTAKNHVVYGLKVSAIFPHEDIYHGNHHNSPTSGRLFEEANGESSKDTSRMLRAGATKVYYLQGDDDSIIEGYNEFCSLIPPGSLIVCESSSLGNHVRPGLHAMVTAKEAIIKPRAVSQLENADIIITSDGMEGFAELDSFGVDKEGNWVLQK